MHASCALQNTETYKISDPIEIIFVKSNEIGESDKQMQTDFGQK